MVAISNNGSSWRMAFRRLISFGFYSGIGVLCDWSVLYALTTFTSLQDWAANIVSSGLGTTIVYLAVTRRTWKVQQSWITYAVFVAWYALVVILCSVFIDTAHTKWGWLPIVGKIATTPLSFLVNYFFNRVLFSSRLVRRADAIEPSAPAETIDEHGTNP
jgi:putative flippase GtrA